MEASIQAMLLCHPHAPMYKTPQISPNVSITNLLIVSYNVRLLLVIYLLQQMVRFYSASHLGEC